MKISLRQIETFCVLARVLHFGRAAEELFVAQAVVSQEMRKLEELIGVRLFDRTTRRVALTEEGRILLPLAQTVYEASKDLNLLAGRLAASPTGPVRLAASPSAMDELVPSVFKEADANPGVSLEEIAVETGRVDRAIESGECDIGLGRFIAVSDRYEVEHVRDDELFVVLSAEHPLAAHEKIDLPDLADLPLLLWRREQHPVYYDTLLAICADRGLEPLVITGRPSIVGARSYLLLENRVFALIPKPATLRLQPGLVARPLSRPASVPLSMVWLRDDPRAGVRTVAAMIRRHAG